MIQQRSSPCALDDGPFEFLSSQRVMKLTLRSLAWPYPPLDFYPDDLYSWPSCRSDSTGRCIPPSVRCHHRTTVGSPSVEPVDERISCEGFQRAAVVSDGPQRVRHHADGAIHSSTSLQILSVEIYEVRHCRPPRIAPGSTLPIPIPITLPPSSTWATVVGRPKSRSVLPETALQFAARRKATGRLDG